MKRARKKRLRTYSIRTDSHSQVLEASNADAAVRQFTSGKVRTVEGLRHWLQEVGGYGVVEGPTGILLRVRG